MSDIFDRLGRLARSVINDFSRDVDSDYKEAWAELDDFLGTDAHDFSGTKSESTDNNRQPHPSTASSTLARDYANLEVTPSANLEEIRKSYKRLLNKYHPDRFGDDPEKQSIATEVTAKLNESYHRIVEVRG